MNIFVSQNFDFRNGSSGIKLHLQNVFFEKLFMGSFETEFSWVGA